MSLESTFYACNLSLSSYSVPLNFPKPAISPRSDGVGEASLITTRLARHHRGLTDYMAVQGCARVDLPGLTEPGCFVVNGAPAASTDQAILEEALTACGFERSGSGVWVLTRPARLSAMATPASGRARRQRRSPARMKDID